MKPSLLFLIVIISISTVAASDPRLKTSRELVSSLEVATNLHSSVEIQSYHNERGIALPQRGSYQEFSKVSLTVVVSLSYFFCRDMIEKDARQSAPSARWAHGEVSFDRAPSEALTPTVQEIVIRNYAELFWQRLPDSEELEQLRDQFDWLASQLPGVAQSTKVALLFSCVSMSSSLQNQVAF